MVNLGGEKMSKSTGLVVDLATLLDQHGGRSLRLLYLRAHYRSPLDYSEELLAEAAEALDRLQRFGERAEAGPPDADALARFVEAMDDDFGTPQAVSLLFDLVREGNRLLDEGGDATAIAGAVAQIVEVLGLDDAGSAGEVSFDLSGVARRFGVSGDDREILGALVAMRNWARAEKRFDEADAIRDELDRVGVTLEDGPHGTKWLRK
jgi:cysteinyl-tRNA synthetase